MLTYRNNFINRQNKDRGVVQRREIMEYLTKVKHAHASKIAEDTGVPLGTIHKHIKRLIECGALTVTEVLPNKAAICKVARL